VLNPDNVVAINNLGLVAGKKKQYAEAVKFFQRAMELKPNSPDPHLNLGRVYRVMGLAGPAEFQLRKALAISSLDSRVRNELGQLLVQEGRMEEAEDQFRTLIRIEPNALAYDFLGMINIRRRAMEEAERDFRAALSLDSSDSTAHFGLGYLYKAAGLKAEALSQYQAGLVKDPTNPQALAATRELRQQSGGATPQPSP
jgi:tetratricopeptide (TPR) repeat protein